MEQGVGCGGVKWIQNRGDYHAPKSSADHAKFDSTIFFSICDFAYIYPDWTRRQSLIACFNGTSLKKPGMDSELIHNLTVKNLAIKFGLMLPQTDRLKNMERDHWSLSCFQMALVKDINVNVNGTISVTDRNGNLVDLLRNSDVQNQIVMIVEDAFKRGKDQFV
jgi:hypothetical protein